MDTNYGVVGGKRVVGLGGLGEWVSGGRLTAGGGEVAGRACPAPTGGERKIVGRPTLRRSEERRVGKEC